MLRNGLAVKVFTHREPRLPLPRDVIGCCIPCGIGDASWVYSKLRHLPEATGYEVWLSMPDADPKRGHQLIELLPDVDWAGYETGWRNEDVFQKTLPGDARPEEFRVGEWNALEVNTWLEKGNRLADWLPDLTTDYHYPISIPAACREQASELLEGLPEFRIAVYVSNRDKEKYPQWSLWSVPEWVIVLRSLAQSVGREVGFVFLGAAYDHDKTYAVMDHVIGGHRSVGVIGYPLATALACLESCDLFLSYPSGIGILANVLRVPGIMLLPAPLLPMEEAYADPTDLANGTYRAWGCPEPLQAVEWLRQRKPWEKKRAGHGA